MPIRPIFKRNRVYGCRRDARDAHDEFYTPDPSLLESLPEVVDLREHCPPVMDQLNIGSCTAHGIVGLLRYHIIKSGRADIPLSRLQLYYDEREAENSIESDAGAEIRNGIKCAAANGVGHEHLWPYDISKFRDRPPMQLYRDALKFQALDFRRVRIERDGDGNHIGASHVKAALAEGFPVVIGVSLYQSFESREVMATANVPMPNLDNEQMVGGHCMYLWGYGQRPGRISDRNSWNTDVGDRGDFYFPEEYIGSRSYGSDYWIIPKCELGD